MNIDIYEVPEDKRYWAVRAEGGKYFDHFSNYGVIALEHLNKLRLRKTLSGLSYEPDKDKLTKDFKSYYEKEGVSRQSISTQLHQVFYFIYEMSIGDWVVTVGSASIRFGRIISSSYISKDKLTVIYDQDTGRKSDMNYHLRRNVQWGPVIPKKHLPYGLSRSFRANQTVFCLDKHWQAIHHTLYPVFSKNDDLYLSARIHSSENIKNHHVAAFLGLLNEIEVIGKEFTKGNRLTKDQFDDVFKNYFGSDELSVTTKAQFHSEGDIWNMVQVVAGLVDTHSWMVYTFLGYAMIFGNRMTGFDGVVDLQTRQKMWGLILDRIKKNNAEKVVEKLQLRLPNNDTSKLEDSSKDEM